MLTATTLALPPRTNIPRPTKKIPKDTPNRVFNKIDWDQINGTEGVLVSLAISIYIVLLRLTISIYCIASSDNNITIYIVLLRLTIPIYCIYGNEYCNILTILLCASLLRVPGMHTNVLTRCICLLSTVLCALCVPLLLLVMTYHIC